MVGDLMVAIWDAVTDFAEMIFDLFSKVGAIPFLLAFTIIGFFISFIVLNRVHFISRGSDSALSSGKSEQTKK